MSCPSNLYDRRGGQRLSRLLALLLALAVAVPLLLAEDSNGDHDNPRVWHAWGV
jgi:hypothetical protein